MILGPGRNRHDRIRMALNQLKDWGWIVDWYAQSKMPGKRWIIVPNPGSMTQTQFTTVEIESWIEALHYAMKVAELE